MKEYWAQFSKNLYDAYFQNNQDWVITVLKVVFPDHFEIYQNLVEPEILLKAIASRRNLEDFNSFLYRKIDYFKNEGVTISEAEIIKLLSYTDNLNDDCDKVFEYHKNYEDYLRKNEEIKKKFPELNDDFYNINALVRYYGDVKFCLYRHFGIDAKIAYSEDIKILKEIPGFENLDDKLVCEKLLYYANLGISNNWENIIYSLKFEADPEKLSLINECGYLPYYNHKEYYEALETHNWDKDWINIFKNYRKIYDLFKDR